MPTKPRSTQDTIDLFNQYVIPNYRRQPVSLVRGEGSYVWDAEENRYLDLFPGWGCDIIGYSPPRVVQAISEQAARLIHVPNSWYIENQGAFAEALCSRSFGQAFFCNSGAEANEAAIKLARLVGSGKRYKIITCERSFHGRTMATTTATGQPRIHEGIGPLLPGFRYAPFGDIEAVRELIDEETCAILVEPVQGEGGVNVAPDGFLQGLRELCDEAGLLLMFDEVQTGMGRLGTWFAYQQFDVRPDVMTLAKGLAGGVACGAMITTKELAPSLRPGMHASTFGGNPLAMAAGLATAETIAADGLLDNCQAMSKRFSDKLFPLVDELPIVREFRCAGLMVGLELTTPAAPVVAKCFERGLLVNGTQEVVIRLLPALNITAEQVDEGCEILTSVLRELAEEGSD